MKKILFLSADDFKEKSIQVIRKTPEAYVNAGWHVTYIVLRDSSNKGNYYYEKEIFLEGVELIRKEIPGTKFLNSLRNKKLSSFVIRIRRYISILFLIVYGFKYQKKYNYDILYGYEQPGAVAAKFIINFFNFRKVKLVLRFQGVVFVKEWLKNNKWYRKITNFETFYALKGPSDLCIMTNDGSSGDWVLKEINSKHKKLSFWINGVDEFKIDNNFVADLSNKLKSSKEVLFLSVSRIDDHKRVDRCIHFINELSILYPNESFKYLIIGEGAKKSDCIELVEKLKLNNKIIFLGAINQSEVPSYLAICDVFLTMYESSNVGNPLLEAIRMNKIILTLNNGQTSDWIQHNFNGFIYEVNDIIDLQKSDYRNMAIDFHEKFNLSGNIQRIKYNLLDSSQKKLWTWKERLDAEIQEVSKLL